MRRQMLDRLLVLKLADRRPGRLWRWDLAASAAARPPGAAVRRPGLASRARRHPPPAKPGRRATSRRREARRDHGAPAEDHRPFIWLRQNVVKWLFCLGFHLNIYLSVRRYADVLRAWAIAGPPVSGAPPCGDSLMVEDAGMPLIDKGPRLFRLFGWRKSLVRKGCHLSVYFAVRPLTRGPPGRSAI